MLQAAREYGKGHQPLAIVTSASHAISGKHSVAAVDTKSPSTYADASEQEYINDVRASRALREFDKLDTEAQLDRKGGRLPGGFWRLLNFYDAVSKPSDNPADQAALWNAQLSLLQEWAAAKPTSATPRVAIAYMYQSYALAARGTGLADGVSRKAWQLYAERASKSAEALVEAARLNEKCPFWFEVAQMIALAQGWNKRQARESFELAAAFEPAYYHCYREYANYLLPKWYGQEGDTEAFAEEVSARLGGQQGQFLYFEIVSQVICQCCNNRPPMPNVSWPRVKQGYAVIGQLDGYSSLKNNRMAFMAYAADDKSAAQEAFSRMGNRDPSVGGSPAAFEQAQAWATGEQAQN